MPQRGEREVGRKGNKTESSDNSEDTWKAGGEKRRSNESEGKTEKLNYGPTKSKGGCQGPEGRKTIPDANKTDVFDASGGKRVIWLNKGGTQLPERTSMAGEKDLKEGNKQKPNPPHTSAVGKKKAKAHQRT